MATSSSSPVRRKPTAANLFRITMNKLLKKKNVPEPLGSNDATVNAFLTGSTPPQQPLASPPVALKKSASRWKRTRKPIETKPEVNFSLTLPSNDDFRTSLFMPALSARFSMLREQDDPASMLGKASDDSVLQPRRRSRMDFGLAMGGLDDIAEVSSVKSAKSAFRPPFAEYRQDSFVSEDSGHSEPETSRTASVMSRSRPGEGNTLFGGRQKVYMISKTGSSSSRGTGRTLYEDDVGTSSFHRPRQRELDETRPSLDAHGFDFGLLDQAVAGDEDEQDDANRDEFSKNLSHSPSLSSSENKWSTHSAHSEARSSTAATSVASQPATSTTSPTKTTSQPPPAPLPAIMPEVIPETAAETTPPASNTQPAKRGEAKVRRLYEQGLDQHMQEQQTSALTRLNSIQRQHTLSNKHPPMYLHSTKSASNIHEKTRAPVFALPESDSPTVPTFSNPFSSAGSSGSRGASPLPSAPVSPLPPQYGLDMDEYNALSQIIEPADRGKATAMGAFNKPKQAFDEQLYSERQRQLQRSASSAASKKAPAPPPVPAHDSNTILEEDEEEDSMPEPSEPRLRSQSAPKEHKPTNAYSVFQRAAQLNAQADAQKESSPVVPEVNQTFFANDSEEEEDPRPNQQATFRMPDYGYGTHHGKWQPTVLPAVLEHPALRTTSSKTSLTQDDKWTHLKPLQTPQTLQPPSPTLGESPRTQTSAGLGLRPLGAEEQAEALRRSRLVQHLRQKSDVSSTTQNSDRTSTIDLAAQSELALQSLDIIDAPAQSIMSTDSRVGSYANSNPWDLDDAENMTRGDDRTSHASISPIDSEQIISPFDARLSTFKDRQSAVSELDMDDITAASQRGGSQKEHTRDNSTATQQDREALDNELAARATAIQESIKNKLEREMQTRGVSPARNSNAGFKPFGMLRSKPSRESVETTQMPEAPSNVPAKALKILGSTEDLTNANRSRQNSQFEQTRGIPNGERSRNNSASRPPGSSADSRSLRQSERESTRTTVQSRSRENSETQPSPAASRSPPSSADSRSRTNSAATSSRSRSRTGPRREDLDRTMVEGTTSTGMPNLPSAPGPRELTPRSTPDIVQSSFEDPLPGSGGKGGMTNYFDSKSLHPIMTGSRERLNPGVPSPALSHSPYSPILSPSPLSPAGSFAHNMTPPLSGASTPLQSSFTPPPPIPFSSTSRQGVLRKKTVSKGDISEPKLISSTSNIDLVNLPEGASLKNGMEEPPPLPPMNPARRATKRILSLGRKESSDSAMSHGSRSKTPEAYPRKTPEPDFSFDLSQIGRGRSDTLSPQKPAPKRSDEEHFSNSLPSSAGSPKPVDRAPAPLPITMDGAMF